jgi:hypothetical protein
MQTDKEKADEILKKRRLAAKGLKERGDGKPVDPMEDIGALDIDNDPDDAETPEEKEREIALHGAAATAALKP